MRDENIPRLRDNQRTGLIKAGFTKNTIRLHSSILHDASSAIHGLSQVLLFRSLETANVYIL